MINSFKSQDFKYLALGITGIAILSSFALSTLFGLKKCALCWYQWVLLIIIAAILCWGIRKHEPDLIYFALPATLAGVVISFYHSLLQWGFINNELSICLSGISCAEQQFSLFGVLTLPSISLLIFIAISILMVLEKRLGVINV